jgi:hypothetical protein
MLAKINDSFITTYKNAEIEIVVEDDLITTSKIFIDGNCVNCSEVATTTNADGAPFNKANYNQVLESCKAEVDKMFDELVAKVSAVAK